MPKIQAIGIVHLQGMLGDKSASSVSFWKERALVVADEITDKDNVVQALEPDGADFPPIRHCGNPPYW